MHNIWCLQRCPKQFIYRAWSYCNRNVKVFEDIGISIQLNLYSVTVIANMWWAVCANAKLIVLHSIFTSCCLKLNNVLCCDTILEKQNFAFFSWEAWWLLIYNTNFLYSKSTTWLEFEVLKFRFDKVTLNITLRYDFLFQCQYIHHLIEKLSRLTINNLNSKLNRWNLISNKVLNVILFCCWNRIVNLKFIHSFICYFISIQIQLFYTLNCICSEDFWDQFLCLPFTVFHIHQCWLRISRKHSAIWSLTDRSFIVLYLPILTQTSKI